MFDFIYNTQICSELISQAPVNLILYTHILSAAIALIVGIMVLYKNRTILGKLLFGITLFFSIWVSMDLIVWLSTNSVMTMMGWSLFWLVTVMIAILSFYFFYVFILNQDLSNIKKFFLFLPILPVVFLTPTTFNLIGFDLINCESQENSFYVWYYFIIGGLSILGILLITLIKWNKIEKTFKKQAVLMMVGLESFLIMFYSLSAVSSYYDNYNIEFYGLFGMVIFMTFLAYLIVKFKEFDIRLIATQALVWAIIIIIGSQFAYIQNDTNRILTAITLILSGTIGIMIVRSVKREIVLREQLEVVNAGQTNLIHIMNHQIKGYLSVDKNIFAELMTDDYGVMPSAAKGIIEKGFDNSNKGAIYVTDILRGASAENGTLQYNMEKFDFKNVVLREIENKKVAIEKKKLRFTTEISEGNYVITGDKILLGEVIRNLIDNSIYYTEAGEITIRLRHKIGKVTFSIIDTGVGIKNEDKPKLFKSGGVGSDSIKINTNSSGYGLAFVKGVVERHGGKVWFESAGANKGTTFFVELPIK